MGTAFSNRFRGLTQTFGQISCFTEPTWQSLVSVIISALLMTSEYNYLPTHWASCLVEDSRFWMSFHQQTVLQLQTLWGIWTMMRNLLEDSHPETPVNLPYINFRSECIHMVCATQGNYCRSVLFDPILLSNWLKHEFNWRRNVNTNTFTNPQLHNIYVLQFDKWLICF